MTRTATSTRVLLKPLREAEEEFRRQYLERAIAAYDGDINAAAHAIKVSTSTAYRIRGTTPSAATAPS